MFPVQYGPCGPASGWAHMHHARKFSKRGGIARVSTSPRPTAAPACCKAGPSRGSVLVLPGQRASDRLSPGLLPSESRCQAGLTSDLQAPHDPSCPLEPPPANPRPDSYACASRRKKCPRISSGEKTPDDPAGRCFLGMQLSRELSLTARLPRTLTMGQTCGYLRQRDADMMASCSEAVHHKASVLRRHHRKKT